MANAAELIIKLSGKDQASGVLKGVSKEAGGLGKTLGDVGKIAGGFLAANVVMKGVGAFKSGIGDSISLASDFNESLSKTRVVFGESSTAIEDFAKSAAVNLGMANGKALEATSTFGNFLQAMGLARQPAADMSMAMVTLAGDLASFNNASPEETLLALRAGLSGEAEPMKRFGVALNETAMKAKAAELGLTGVNGVLTEGEKVQARYAIIMEQTAVAQGDFARTSDGLANKQRIAAAKMEDLKTTIGKGLLPVQLALTTLLTDKLIPAISKLTDFISNRVVPVLKEWWQRHGPAIIQLLKDAGRGALEMGRGVANFLAPALDTLTDLWTNLQPPLKAVWELIQSKVLPVLKKVGQFLMEHKPLLIAIGAVVLTLVSPWLAVAAAIVVVLAKWDEISQFFTVDVPAAIDAFLTKIKEIPIIGEIFEGAFEEARIIVETVFDLIKTNVETAINAIKDIIQIVTALIHGDWDEAWTGIKNLVTGIWIGIYNNIVIILDAIKQILWSRITALKDVVEDAWGLVKSYFAEDIPNWFRNNWKDVLLGVFGGIPLLLMYKFRDKLKDAIIAVSDSLKQKGTSIANWVWEGIKTLIDKALQLGKDIVSKLWEGIKSMKDWLLEQLGGFIDSIIDKLNPANWDIPGLSPLPHAYAEAGRIAGEAFGRGLQGGFPASVGATFTPAGMGPVAPAAAGVPIGRGGEYHIHIGEHGMFLGDRREIEALWERLRPYVLREFR